MSSANAPEPTAFTAADALTVAKLIQGSPVVLVGGQSLNFCGIMQQSHQGARFGGPGWDRTSDQSFMRAPL